jgi:DNA-binding transcriptional ArsR family regulator
LRAYKALSDERRLRILRRLSEGETSLDELTELLDLSKSTVHHHISILRGAGLIRVHLAADEEGGDRRKYYTLREQSLADATGLLDSYLRTEQQGAKHV